MKALVVGGGSIGMRHVRNLRRLGIDSLGLYEPDAGRREQARRESGPEVFDSLEAALRWEPYFVVIASPTHLHVEQALEAARMGCHLFIEKPLSHTGEKLCKLAEEIERKGLVSLVGCNMRFHPGPARVRELLEKGAIGRVLFARVHTGSYLPGWRPGQDYRESYSANASMGGGCILDCIHEIDLARWYMGEVEEVFCVAGHVSSLEIDCEDVAALICRHAGGSVSEIHLDYVQRSYERGCQVVGEQGSIFWDFNGGTVRLLDAAGDSWSTFSGPEGWQINDMYLEETEHFLDCVRAGIPTTLPVSDAVNVMRVAFAAKTSAASGCMVKTREVLR